MKDTISFEEKSFVILKRLYNRVKYDTETYVSVFDLTGENFTRDEAIQIWKFLINEGWVKEGVKATGTPDMHITSHAIKEIESGALSHRIQDLEHLDHEILSRRQTAPGVLNDEVSQKGKKMSEIDIFISHSSDDLKIVEAIIELLRIALNIPAERIRCTSVDVIVCRSAQQLMSI